VGVVIVPTYPARPGSTTGQLDGALDGEGDDALAGLVETGVLRELPARARLDTEQSVKRQLVELYGAAKAGRISTLEANRLAKLLAAISAANEKIHEQPRLDRLEQLLDNQAAGRRRGR
jgi:hypothetical protein